MEKCVQLLPVTRRLKSLMLSILVSWWQLDQFDKILLATAMIKIATKLACFGFRHDKHGEA